jgi:hypothetical protein
MLTAPPEPLVAELLLREHPVNTRSDALTMEIAPPVAAVELARVQPLKRTGARSEKMDPPLDPELLAKSTPSACT